MSKPERPSGSSRASSARSTELCPGPPRTHATVRPHPDPFLGHGDTVVAPHVDRQRAGMIDLLGELVSLGGVAAPATATARLRDVLLAALRRGVDELAKPRSGYEVPVEIAFAAGDGVVLAATPADAAFRADPEAAGERTWLLVAAVIASLVDLTEPGPPASPADLGVRAGDLGGFLLLGVPGRVAPSELDELAPLAFEEHAGGLDRLRTRAVAAPARLLDGPELREPIGGGAPPPGPPTP